MSIQPLLHLTLVGREADRERALRGLQRCGYAHLESLRATTTPADVSTAADGRKALRYLEAAQRAWHASREPAGFDAARTVQNALALERRGRELLDEQQALRRRMIELSPWGEFEFDMATPEARRFWFYVVPNHKLRHMPDGLCWQAVHQDPGFSYVVVIASAEPAGIPGPRTHAGTRGLAQLRARFDALQLALDELESERAREARWRLLLRRSLEQLDDEAELLRALGAVQGEGVLFHLAAWIPASRAAEAESFALSHGLACMLRPPAPDEDPPTLLANDGFSAFGADVMRFYEVPDYRGWDPSASVFWFLAVFVAVMLGDAGYSLLLAAGLLAAWRALGRTDALRRARRFAAAAITVAVLWGVAVGSWFGAGTDAREGAIPGQLLDLADTGTYVAIALSLGIVQIAWANLATAWHVRGSAAVARLGWVLLLAAGVMAWWTRSRSGALFWDGPATWLAVAAIACIVGFTAPQAPVGARLGRGAFALTRAVSLASDVLSYLRLFAIGYAGAALAGAFGELAGQAREGNPGLGGLLAFLILLLGHGANLVLGVTSALVHGLRLNLIEYLNWAVDSEGRQFVAFSRKVGMT